MSDEINETAGAPIKTVIFTAGQALYQVAGGADEKACWLSVERFPGAAPAHEPRPPYLGAVASADGTGWRKAYSAQWTMALPESTQSLPADDVLVADYEAAISVVDARFARKDG